MSAFNATRLDKLSDKVQHSSQWLARICSELAKKNHDEGTVAVLLRLQQVLQNEFQAYLQEAQRELAELRDNQNVIMDPEDISTDPEVVTHESTGTASPDVLEKSEASASLEPINGTKASHKLAKLIERKKQRRGIKSYGT
ncbi:hypothetical protein Poli38472_004644 [Pythium oligandrum]|uniref:Uncharacterized protein n=1 Tax=Pythium oligandrum TaxID=41045 RepID=A0A8K1CAM1_PYTOL|nr:hypothetical protein Poli38472_004644 [Pythium oligandrum]|eukprot:TMW59575.1 hypothetical protein Poli38472_004644 [Pythium oligandrum]